MVLPKIVSMVLKDDTYIRIANAMLAKVKNGQFDDSKEKREAICSEAHCSSNQFYSVRGLLLEMNLIEKQGRQYTLNRNFVSQVLKEWLNLFEC